MNLEPLVNLLLREYVGGVPFFNKLDDKIRKNDYYISYMIKEVTSREIFDYVIVSGDFGKYFYKYCKKNELLNNKIICVNGSLRKGEDIIPFWNNYNIVNKRIIFIDDSYYSGKTARKIQNAIKEHHGIFLNTYVFYDGSKIKDDNVYSFYRYYDYY